MGFDLSSVSGRRILVVDDDAATLKLVANYLQHSMPQCEVRKADDGAEAYKLTQEWAPHILLTDIKMPNMDGLELLMRIKLDQLDTLVIIFTARDDEEAANQSMKYGAQAYLHKPLEMQELLLACKEAMDQLEQAEGQAGSPLTS